MLGCLHGTMNSKDDSKLTAELPVTITGCGVLDTSSENAVFIGSDELTEIVQSESHGTLTIIQLRIFLEVRKCWGRQFLTGFAVAEAAERTYANTIINPLKIGSQRVSTRFWLFGNWKLLLWGCNKKKYAKVQTITTDE